MILLSFDIEEFDMPFEYGKEISFDDQMQISITGTEAILDILARQQVKATFFSTVVFAKHATATIQRLLSEGHELASHGYYHSDFKVEHLRESKLELEKLFHVPVNGYRMARMQPVDDVEIERAGYLYNSSINPTWLPGRYNNLHVSRVCFSSNNVLQIPASVTPFVRFPLFWLSFHNLPLNLYVYLARWTMQHDRYLNVYFHPWEFTDLNDKERFGFPFFVRKNTGGKMQKRMEQFIQRMKKNNAHFVTLTEFQRQYNANTKQE
jgi:peptidoglycan/xylan/chitin deacetylase (PgdA/CDA1 family)